MSKIYTLHPMGAPTFRGLIKRDGGPICEDAAMGFGVSTKTSAEAPSPVGSAQRPPSLGRVQLGRVLHPKSHITNCFFGWALDTLHELRDSPSNLWGDGVLGNALSFKHRPFASSLVTALCWVLCIQIALSPVVYAVGPTQQPTPARHGQSGTSHIDEILDVQGEDPFLQSLQPYGDPAVGQAYSEHVHKSLKTEQDQDPYFLRSQTWSSAEGGSAPRTSAGLNIPGLQPIGSSEQYAFYAATDTLSPHVGAEGVFAVEIEDALQAQSENRPTPVFYIPLPTDDEREATWAGPEVAAIHSAAARAVIFVDSAGEMLPVLEEDINSLIQVSRVAFTLALAESLRTLPKTNRPIDLQAAVENARPLPGSTAVYGLFYVGAHSPLHSAHDVNQAPGLWSNKFARLVATVLNGVIPSAQAMTGVELLGAGGSKLAAQLIRFSVIAGAALVVSVVAKYTVLKKRIHQKRNCEQKLTVSQIVKREIVEIGDVYAHTLTVLAQLPGVWFGNTLEYMGDRLAPSVLSGSNKRLRKVLDSTVYFVREVSRRIPVSAYTFLMGALVLGGIDTILYYVQLYHLVPSMAEGMGDMFPALKSRIDEAYAIGNPNTADLNRYSVVRCAVYYFTSGAANMSVDLRGQLIDGFKIEVDEELRHRGLNPLDPNVAQEREALLNQKLDAALSRTGLPGHESFLFDAQTMYNGILKTLGYDLPGELQYASEKERAQYAGLERPGLVISAVQAALKEARKEASTAENDDAARAVELLQKLSTDLSLLRTFAQNPTGLLQPGGFRQTLDHWRNTKRQLVALTYIEKNPKAALKNIPAPWGDLFSAPGAALAAELFRKAYFSYMSGDHIDAQIQERRQDQESLRTGVYAGTHYEPKLDKFGQYQQKKILKEAKELYLAEAGAPFNPERAPATEWARWYRLYTQAYMKTLGLHPDQTPMPHSDRTIIEDVHRSASEGLSQQLVADPLLRAHLDALPAQDRARYSALLYAETTVQQYLQFTWGNDAVPALSTAQPGRLQWLRGRGFMRRSPVLTRAARVVEAVFGDHSYRLGLSSALSRSLPIYSDFRLANSRAYRSAVTSGVANYPFNQYFWGVTISPALWVLNLIARFTVNAPSQYLNRMFRMLGLKPMSNTKNMVLFGVIYAFATFWGSIPMQVFSEDYLRGWNAVMGWFSRVFTLN